MKKNIILFVVAHTDDETIGSGGTIARHKSLGDKVYAMSFTDGISSRKKNQDKKIRQRLEASKKASKILAQIHEHDIKISKLVSKIKNS